MSTTIDVRVIAVGGKFVGDDIGGAAIAIRDAFSGAVLTQGVTKGDSGPNQPPGSTPPPCGVMCASLKRGQPLPMTETTSVFTASLSLASATRIEVTAFGPLAARGSANTVSATTWVYPGMHMTAGNGLLLELPGLLCQIINPPTHTKQLAAVTIVANVAIMCGCPISNKTAAEKTTCPVCPSDPQPWLPADFMVYATLESPSQASQTIQLTWNGPVPGNFTTSVSTLAPGTYQVTVYAQQISTGNTGVDLATFTVPASS